MSLSSSKKINNVVSDEARQKLNEELFNILVDSYGAQKDIATILLQLVVKTFKCNRSIVRFYNYETKRLYIANRSNEYLSDKTQRSILEVGLSEDFFDYVLNEYKTNGKFFQYNVEQMKNHVSHRDYSIVVDELKIKSFYCMPIYKSESFVGVLVIFYTEKPVELSEADLSLFSKIAKDIVFMINYNHKNMELAKKAKREDLVRRVIEGAQDGFDVEQLKNDIVQYIGKDLCADRCILIEYDNNNQSLFDSEIKYIYSNNEVDVINKNPINIHHEISRLKLYENFFCVYNAKEYIGEYSKQNPVVCAYLKKYNIKSGFCIPIQFQEKTYGILVVHYTDKYNAFDEGDAEFAEVIANQISIIINQAELYQQAKMQAQREKVISEISRELTRIFDLKELKKTIVNKIGQMYNADRCVLSNIDPIKDEISIIQEYEEYRKNTNVKSLVGVKLNKRVRNNIARNIKKDNFILLKELLSERKDVIAIEKEEGFFKEYKVRSGAVIAIKHNDIILGSLSLYYASKIKEFDKDEVSFLNTIADQVGVALYQAKQYERQKEVANREKRLAQIISKMRNTSRIEDALLIISSNLADFYSSKNIFLCMYNKNKNSVRIFKDYSQMDSLEEKYSLNSYIFNKFLKHSSFTFIDDFKKVKDFKKFLAKYDCHSIIAASKKVSSNEYIGFVILRETKTFSPNLDEDFIQTLLDQVNYAIKDTNLNNQKQFISNVSHEIKTPMAIIKGYAEALLNREKSISPGAKTFLNTIISNVDRMNNIISTLLYFSEVESLQGEKDVMFEKLRLEPIILECIDIYKKKAGNKKISFVCKCKSKVFIKANKTLLQQAIGNLIENAINYSEDNTNIVIECSSTAQIAKLRVIDQGVGIKDEYIGKVFNKFYRVDSEKHRYKKGTGLGLSIVKIIAEMHNGTINVESEYKKGSSFILSLPVN